MASPPVNPPASAGSPSAALLGALRQELARHPPFSGMQPGDVDWFIERARQRYYAPGDLVVQPDDGPVDEIFYIREGAVTGMQGLADVAGGAFRYEPGDLFPLGAAMARRPVTATYRSAGDTFVLALDADDMQSLAGRSTPFADFLNRRVLHFLDLSRRALQAEYAAQALAEQSLESPLAGLATRMPITCSPDTPLRDALAVMEQRRVGSMLVTDPSGHARGILTRHDVLGRVVLPEVSLDAPIRDVMVAPVHALTTTHTAQDAALLMSRHGIRHVPVTQDGMVVGMVSERDLFALQRLTLRQVSGAIRAATDESALCAAAAGIRQLARALLGQGVQARQLTALVTHLNDLVVERLVQLLGPPHGVNPEHICWIALGSEGRGEQTVVTDQDNALILPDGTSDGDRAAALALGRAVNRALDACGYPLCPGGIMAGEAACCLTLAEWQQRFAHWIDQGGPEDLLKVSIFFDFRPVAGHAALAHRLREDVLARARATPRFLKQLALNALGHAAPLNWHGGLDLDGHGALDLKLQGTALFVDGARLYALAHGVAATGTRDRLEAAHGPMGLPRSEADAWSGAFEFLQMLRLRVQVDGQPRPGEANRIQVDSLNDIDRRILREAIRVARQVQQRMRLDYDR